MMYKWFMCYVVNSVHYKANEFDNSSNKISQIIIMKVKVYETINYVYKISLN